MSIKSTESRKWVDISKEVWTSKKAEHPKTYHETHSFNLNPNDNGGENVSLLVHVHNNGDGATGWYFETELSLQCYGTHSTSINIQSGLSPRNIQEIGTYLIGLSHEYPSAP